MNASLKPKVSIVMPTYNRADLLPDTINAILDQDFDDFELIIVDDGSEDNTINIIEQICQMNPFVHYIKLPENHGNAFARNVGIQIARGKYIALADSDDLWLPGKLKLQVNLLERYPEIDILFGNYWNIDYVRGTEADGFAETRYGNKHLTTRHVGEKLWVIEDGFETGMLAMNFIATPTMILKADVYKKVKNYNETLKSAVDFEFCVRAALLDAKYAFTDQILIKRYRYQSSITAQIVNTNKQMLRALSICRQTCESVQRFDLLNYIRAAELRTCQRLIRQYAIEGERSKAWHAYVESTKYGLSLRAILLLIGALAGVQAVSGAMKLKRTLQFH